MNASELYDLVRECPKVWSGTLEWWGGMAQWGVEDDRVHVGETAAELILEALFARATGLGVGSFVPMGAAAPVFYGFNRHGQERCINHPSRLEALVAAYAAGVRP